MEGEGDESAISSSTVQFPNQADATQGHLTFCYAYTQNPSSVVAPGFTTIKTIGGDIVLYDTVAIPSTASPSATQNPAGQWGSTCNIVFP